jgi:acetyl esterase/lipase
MDIEKPIPPGLSQDRRGAIKKLRCLTYNPKVTAEVFRDQVEAAFYDPRIPKGVAVKTERAGDITFDLHSPKTYAQNRLIFYVHGGSFIAGSAKSWRTFCATLADECSTRLVVPNYRLAPAFPFPTALEDLQNVFRQVFNGELEKAQRDMLTPPEILVAGDGAGADLAVALLLNLRSHVRVHVKHLVLLSPWLDLSAGSALRAGGGKKRVVDEILNPKAYETCIDYYTYTSNLENPLVSPVTADPKNFDPFPSVYIQMGGAEALLPDVERFCTLLKESNVTHTLEVWPRMMHLFQMADEHLTDAQEAIKGIGVYIRK